MEQPAKKKIRCKLRSPQVQHCECRDLGSLQSRPGMYDCLTWSGIRLEVAASLVRPTTSCSQVFPPSGGIVTTTISPIARSDYLFLMIIKADYFIHDISPPIPAGKS